MLPGMDGLEVMRRLRTAGNGHRVPVILLTAKGEPADRVIGLRLGADDYVAKPFSPAELVARVDAVLRRVDPEPQFEEPIVFGDLELDPVARRVTVRGEEAQLTVREYDLLLHLMRHPGQVFSRDQLMDNVWQYAFYSDTSTVTVHIRRLRAKIEEDPPSRAGSRPSGAWVTGSMSARAGVLLLALAAAVGGLIVGLSYSIKDGALTAVYVGAAGAPAVAAAHLLVRRRRSAGSSRQFTVAIALTVALITAGLGVVALLMLLSNHDLLITTLLLAFAGALTWYATAVPSRGVLADIESLRDGLQAVGEGDRDVRIATRGRDELAELAAAANEMAGQLAEREAERDLAEAAP